jgi:hypothetical protein
VLDRNMENSDYNPIPETVHAIFKTKEGAEKAYEELTTRGYNTEEITVLISDETKLLHFPKGDTGSNSGNKTLEKTGLGSAIGGTAGRLVSEIIGAFTSSGISDQHVEHYEKSLKEGGIILGFKPKTVEDRIEIITVWNEFGGRQVHED